MKIILGTLVCTFIFVGCASGVKPPPQCEGTMRPLNGIQLSVIESKHACINQTGVA